MNSDADDDTLDPSIQHVGEHAAQNDDDRDPNQSSNDDSFELASSLADQTLGDPTLGDQDQDTDQAQSLDLTRDSLQAPSPPSSVDSSPDRTLDSSDAKKSLLDTSSDDHFSVHQSVGASQKVNNTATASFAGSITDIGRYKAIRILGEGAFGYVFEAHDPQLDRKVAVKVAKSINSQHAIERFLREARSAAQLRHPNIIPVHEYGKVDGKHIIVYEYIEGETLKSYISRNRPLPLEETLRLVRLIACGLDYAHSKGIIHRDMKPDNVMIDQSGQPHIADFGCARSLEADVSLTMDGSILGTPTYMSPEQASGRSNTADGRTDIWSLGVMLYEMVAGKKPFSGKLTDLLFWIRNHDPPPLRTHNAAAPVDIETICIKCLQRELSDRFTTAQELADEIERFERGEPIRSRPVTLFRRLTLWRRRNPTVANLLATVAVTLIAGISVSTYYAYEAWRARNERVRAQLVSVTTAKATEVPTLLKSLQPSRSTVLPILRERLDEVENTSLDSRRLRTALLYFETNEDTRASLSSELTPQLLDAEPDLLMVAREVIVDNNHQIANEKLWPIVANRSGKSAADQRLRAACLLSKLDTDSKRWPTVADDLSGILVDRNLLESVQWLPGLSPIRNHLRPSLKNAFQATSGIHKNRSDNAAALLARLFGNQPEIIVQLVESATPTQLQWLIKSLETAPNKACEHLTDGLNNLASAAENEATVIAKSNLIIAMIQLQASDLWQHLDRQTNISVATEIIERLGPSAGQKPVAVDHLTQQLVDWTSARPGQLASLMLSMGQFSNAQIPQTRRSSMLQQLMIVFNQHPNAEVHSAARWLLQQWDADSEIAEAERKLRDEEPIPGHQWHVDLSGNTFVIFEPVDQFLMGTSKPLMDRAKAQASYIDGEQQHLRRIPRRFGICIHEVTSDQFAKFEHDMVKRWKQKLATLDSKGKITAGQLKAWIDDVPRRQKNRSINSPNAPVTNITWLHSLAYCRWLSDTYSTGHCLTSVTKFHQYYDDKEDANVLQKHIRRPGYRLPTAAEWEYVCRAKTDTLRPTGVCPARLQAYAWHGADRNFSPQPVGILKPNGFGMFDMLGNVNEWCLNWHQENLPDLSLAISDDLVSSQTSEPIWLDMGDSLTGWQSDAREHRGGCYFDNAGDVRTSKRARLRQYMGLNVLGFRLARTYVIEDDQ